MSAKTIKLRKTYKYRLYGSRRNKHLQQSINVAGLIWNHAIALHKGYYKLTGKYIPLGRMQKQLSHLRMHTERYAFWKVVGSQAVQDIAKRIDDAYQRFFDDRKRGRPRFKKVRKYKSFTLKQASWKLLGGNKIQIHGRNYKFANHRPLQGKIKTVTIKRDPARRLWVCFSVEVEIEIKEVSTGKSGGFDLGLKTFLTDDEGKPYMMPQYFKRALKQIAKLSRAVARKRKGSRRRRQAVRCLALAHAHLADKRRDYHFKLAHKLCNKYDVLYFEDLNLRGMKALWGRKVSDLSFGNFMDILKHVAQQRGVRVCQIDRFEPTSQTCSQCGQRKKMSLRERWYSCAECGLELDRDHNAALNIKQVGIATCG